MRMVTNLRDYRKMVKEEGQTTEETEKQLKEMMEQLSIQYDTYTGDHKQYGEEEDEFAVRVEMAINDFKVNYSPEQLESLKYFYFLLKITENSDKENPLLIDIEAFEDIIEPFIIQIYLEDMKHSNLKLSTLTTYAGKMIEDLLLSDFIFSPFKSNEGDRRFICITPELNYAMENLIGLPEKYKIETDISLKEGGRYKSTEMIIEEGSAPYFRVHLTYDEDGEGELILVSHIELSVSDMAKLYFNTEYVISQTDYDINEMVLTLLARRLIGEFSKAISSDLKVAEEINNKPMGEVSVEGKDVPTAKDGEGVDSQTNNT